LLLRLFKVTSYKLLQDNFHIIICCIFWVDGDDENARLSGMRRAFDIRCTEQIRKAKIDAHMYTVA